MKRREVMALVVWPAIMCALPPTARAQRGERIPRIGFLSPFSPAVAAHWDAAFRQGLRDLGWIEGKNLLIEYRYAEGKPDLLADLALDLVSTKVDLIVTAISTDALVAKAVTKTIPIVVASAGDPVGSGLAESLSRPGGNVTGLSQVAPELSGKRLELLREMVPSLSRIAVLWNPRSPTSSSPLTFREMGSDVRRLGLELLPMEARTPEDFAPAFAALVGSNATALVITPDPLFASNMKTLAEAALNALVPAVFHLKEFAEVGGLASYGIDRADQFRRAAGYVDRILKGANPADLPIEEPNKFELVLNIRTARALGLKLGPALLGRADEVVD